VRWSSRWSGRRLLRSLAADPAVRADGRRTFASVRKKTLETSSPQYPRNRREKGPGDDLLGILMEAKVEGSSEGMSDEQLRDEVITMVLAGHETTANCSRGRSILVEASRRRASPKREAVRVLGDSRPKLEDLAPSSLTRRVLENRCGSIRRRGCSNDKRPRGTSGGFPVATGSIIASRRTSPPAIRISAEPPRDSIRTRSSARARSGRVEVRLSSVRGVARTCIENHFAMMRRRSSSR